MSADSTTPGRRRLRVALLCLAALGALGVLGASVAVYLARGAIRSKAESLAAGLGLTLEIHDVDVPLVGGIGLRDVDVRRADGTIIAHLDRIETDVSLVGAALGARRPGRVELIGGSAILRWDDGPVNLKRVEPAAPTVDDGKPSEAIAFAIRGLALTIEARQTTPLGVVTAEPLRLEDLDATVTRDAQRHVTGKASGTFVSAGHRSAVRVAVDLAGKALSFESDDGVEVGLETPLGPTWVALGSARHAPGTPFEAAGIGVRRGNELLQVKSVVLRGGGDGLLPVVGLVEGADLVGIVAQHGDDHASIGKASLTLAPSPRGPLPSAIALSDVTGSVKRDGRELSGSAAAIEVGFSDLAAHLADGTLTDAVSALKLERPAATLVLPAAPLAPGGPVPPGAADPKDPKDPRDPKTARDAQAAPADGAPEGGNEDPLQFMGNDDDLPPAEKVVPALAPGRDWLGALLGSDDGDGDGNGNGKDGPAVSGLASMIPPAIYARLPGLLARIGALAPHVSDGSLTVVDSAGKSLLSLQDAGFGASRVTGPDGGLTSLDMRASVLRDGKEAGRADLRLTVTDDLVLDSLEGTLSGRSLAHQIARFVHGLSVQEDAGVDLQIQYQRPESDNAPHHVQGTLSLSSFSFEFWRIADREIRDLEAKVAFDASIDRVSHRLLLTLSEIKVGEARLTASLDLTKKKKHLPSFVARVEMPRQDCAAAGRSIPKGLIPNLPTLALRGQMDFKASLTLDLENPAGLSLAVDGDADDCQILSLGPKIDIEALRGPFVHHPLEPKRGVLEHIAVGRGTPEWISSERIPAIVKTAAWVTEDRAWLAHKGVRWGLVERALKIDLEYGRFIYGGSTITQQLVKNMFLTRDKNLARKLEEAIIAWQMERILTKDEILTLYINCIEYGPDIYGIKQAARIYFGKRPSELDALESAFIMGLKPYPSAGYNQFLKGTLDVWWVRRVSHVLDYMVQFAPDQITAEEVAAFAPFQPNFRKP